MVTTMAMAKKKEGGVTRQRVSQSTINDIKRMGMKKALELAGRNASATQAGVTAEWAEGVRRMYGQARYDAAVKATSKAAKAKAKPKSNFTYGANSAPKMPGKGPMARMSEAAAKKKSGTTDPFARAVIGGAKSVGRALSVEPRVSAAQAKKNLEAKKRAQSKAK